MDTPTPEEIALRLDHQARRAEAAKESDLARRRREQEDGRLELFARGDSEAQARRAFVDDRRLLGDLTVGGETLETLVSFLGGNPCPLTNTKHIMVVVHGQGGIERLLEIGGQPNPDAMRQPGACVLDLGHGVTIAIHAAR